MHISLALNEGDEVLIQDQRTSVTNLVAVPVYYDLKENTNWEPDFRKLDLTKVKIMWIGYPHMPTGARECRFI
jgi:aspartate/methionine/tyrosine aminotransferase